MTTTETETDFATQDFLVTICEPCLALDGEMCHTPGCILIRHKMEEVKELLDVMQIRMEIDGEVHKAKPETTKTYHLPDVKPEEYIDDDGKKCIRMGQDTSGFIKNLRSGVYERPVELLYSTYPGLPQRLCDALVTGKLPYRVDEEGTVIIDWHPDYIYK